MPKISPPSLFEEIQAHFTAITFTPGDVFYWSPKEKTIYFDPHQLKKKEGTFQLLHEIGHAKCDHTNYHSSIELMKMEVAAWEEAKKLAEQFGIEIADDHIERCLDSYRDWLHLRSNCPTCHNTSIETKENHYQCFNCLQQWRVPVSQQARSYRLRLDLSS